MFCQHSCLLLFRKPHSSGRDEIRDVMVVRSKDTRIVMSRHLRSSLWYLMKEYFIQRYLQWANVTMPLKQKTALAVTRNKIVGILQILSGEQGQACNASSNLSRER